MGTYVRLKYILNLNQKGGIPSVTYISVGNNACNTTCGKTAECQTVTPSNGSNTEWQDESSFVSLISSVQNQIASDSRGNQSSKSSSELRVAYRRLRNLRNQWRSFTWRLYSLYRSKKIKSVRYWRYVIRKMAWLRKQRRALTSLVNKLIKEAKRTNKSTPSTSRPSLRPKSTREPFSPRPRSTREPFSPRPRSTRESFSPRTKSTKERFSLRPNTTEPFSPSAKFTEVLPTEVGNWKWYGVGRKRRCFRVGR